MGSGIAESTARAGSHVLLYEPEDARLDGSRKRIEASIAKAVKGGKLDEEGGKAMLGRISWTTDFAALANAQLAIEAVVEDEGVKADVFGRLDATLPPESILASNTSSIPIAQLAAATSRPDRVLGLHFFSPVPVMKLVEIVVALDTSEETVARAASFVDALGKTAVRTKDRSGFVVNFLLVPYLWRRCGCTRRASPPPRTSTRR